MNGETVPPEYAPEHPDQFVVSVQVDGEEVWVHRSRGARTDGAAGEFALRSWLLGRDRAPLIGKTIQAVVMASPLSPSGRTEPT